ncbi:MAG: hypothetical protein GXX87_04790 [Euryarchaeota archaeon]|jgi:hypothetical protein|nr:hypothetical protein [Euryarchaeota archaeon]
MGSRLGDSRTLGLIGFSAVLVYAAALMAAIIMTTGFEPGSSALSELRGAPAYVAGTVVAGVLGIVAGAGLFIKSRDGVFIAKVRGALVTLAAAALILLGVSGDGSLAWALFMILAVFAALSETGFNWISGRNPALALSGISVALMVLTAMFTGSGLPFAAAAAFWVASSSLPRILEGGPDRQEPEASPTVRTAPAVSYSDGSADVAESAPPNENRPATIDMNPPAAPTAVAIRPAEPASADAPVQTAEPERAEELPKLRIMSSKEAATARDAKMSEDKGREAEAAPEGETDADGSHEDAMMYPETPDVMVRRAAWNKGLRCRRDYGPHRIPVAFVKSRVAVYVSPDESGPTDEKLRSEGWTVLRYKTDGITDGKEQAEEIARTVRENLKAQRASKKKGAGR